jgi:hypothetical protein
MMMRPDGGESGAVIRASEIGEYVFCARAWWLHRVQGIATQNREALRLGRTGHDRHGRTVASAQGQARLALWLGGSGAVMALLAILLMLVGQTP